MMTAAAARTQRIRILAGVVFASLVAVVAVVVLTGPGDDRRVTGSEVQGIAGTQALLAGIEQHGFTLGDPKAPVQILEFLDLQCPYCQAHQLDEQPTVIKQLIRTGKAKITLSPAVLLGEDSQRARVVLARLAAQGKAWNFANLFYLNQGNEGTGYATDAYLRRLVTAIPGVPASDADPTPGPPETKLLDATDALRTSLGVAQYPTFAVGRSDRPTDTYRVLDLAQKNARPSAQLAEAVAAVRR